MEATLTAAHTWAQAGVSVVPVATDGTKRPAIDWKQYTTTPATSDQITTWFTDTPYGIGIVCGPVSGELEMLEVEGRAVTDGTAACFVQLLEDHGLADLWRRIQTGYMEMTPSGGMHWLYRVTDGPARRNMKLASRPSNDTELAANPRAKVQVLIETRGAGGFVVVAPTAGNCHPSGQPWRLLGGGPDTIASITVEERDQIHAIATLLDQMPTRDPAPVQHGTGPTGETSGLRPGDDYNQRASWDDILTPHGWTKVRPMGSGWSWVRPGKDARDGISATTGQVADADRLYVFTTSTDFESEVPYSKFGAYALLEHDGDYAAAAKQLRADGYGSAERPPTPVQMRPLRQLNAGRPTSSDEPVADGALATVHQLPPARGTLDTWTDQGNAGLFVARHAAGLRYVPSRGAWLRWDHHRWIECEDDGEAVTAMVDTIQSIQTGSDDGLAKHKTRSLSRRGLEGAVAIARRDEGMRVAASKLDADPWALNTPTGVVDLRTGTSRPGTPDDLFTYITRAPYDPDAPAPQWEAFLDQTFDGDTELIDYMQRLAGYSATGTVTDHVLPFLHGKGGNGKTVFLESITKALGTYAAPAPLGFLLEGGKQDESAVADLAGRRFVIASEVNQKDKFDEAKIKVLTGGDTIRARHLYARHFSFEPSHTIWLMGNHQPRVDAGGVSFWRRLRLIPFTTTVAPEKKDRTLGARLIEQESAGILAWVVRGAIAAIRDGLQDPASVINATDRYAEEEDALARFVTDCCMVGGGEHVRINTKNVRSAYEQWCREEGERPVSPQVFGRELRTRFDVGQAKSNGARLYTNLSLRQPEPEEDNGRVDRWGDR